jgi:hypothetical protein
VPSYLDRVYELFPERRFSIAQLAGRDRVFNTLCEEYGLAAEALANLDALRSHSVGDMVRIAEYRALIEDLKDDLERQLADVKQADRSG